MYAGITLLFAGEKTGTEVYAKVRPVGRDEVMEAAQHGLKSKYCMEVWENEYKNENEVEYNGKRLTVYRTYGPKPNGKIEVYVAERSGAGW